MCYDRKHNFSPNKFLLSLNNKLENKKLVSNIRIHFKTELVTNRTIGNAPFP